MLKIILVVGVLIFVAFSLGFFDIPGAEVVGGRTGYVMIKPTGAVGADGAEYIVKQSYGVFTNYDKCGEPCSTDECYIGAFIGSSRKPWDKDFCESMGGSYENWETIKCNLPGNHFGLAGVENLKVTAGKFTINCGTFFKESTANEMVIKPTGTWFPGIDLCTHEMNPDQLQHAQQNTACTVNGRIWVNAGIAEVCVPDWSCTGWSSCTQQNTQIRECSDINECGTLEGKPVELQSCVYEPPEEQPPEEEPPEERPPEGEPEAPVPTDIFTMFIDFINGILTGIGAFFNSLLNI